MENQSIKETNDGINSIIDIRGIQFDISSVLKDVTNSIKNNLKTSFDDVFKDYELYKSTHDALLQIPFIKDMCNKNLELSLQVEIMKQDHHDDEDEPTITLNIHETLPDEKENNHDNEGEEDINKPIFTEFLKTTKTNKKQYENDFEFEIVSEVEAEEEEEEAASETEEENEESSQEEEEAEETEEEEAEESQEEEEEEEEEKEEEEESQEEAEEEAAEEPEEEEEEESQEEAEEEAAEEPEEAEEEEAEEEAEEEEAAEEPEEAEEEEEVYEIVIKNVTYYTTNEKNGDIYSCVNDDVGEIVGKFKNGKPSFIKRK